MPYEIHYSNEAVAQLKKLRAFDRTAILDQIEEVLGVNPTAVSKSRVKRLREPAPTQYRLRVGEFRVFTMWKKKPFLSSRSSASRIRLITSGDAMTVQSISDPNTPISEVLKAAGSEGIVLESENQGRYALIPLDDDLIDFLIERNPKFRAECRQIREQMDAGQFYSHEEVRRQLHGD